jgi:3-oxoacyl-[acyl-carrier-protein] synthase II
MTGSNDIVITGVGCVTPIGIGRASFWDGLHQGRCGIRLIHQLEGDKPLSYFGGVIDNFDGKNYVTPRKAMKVMNREVQTAFAAAQLAIQDAGLQGVELDPDRMGVIYGAEMFPGEIPDLMSAIAAAQENGVVRSARWGGQFTKHIMPLWMLKNLPNMPACHVAIAQNARGPSNTIVQEEVSGLQALMEAAVIIQRDAADVMVVGAVGGRVSPTRLIYRDEPQYGHLASTGRNPKEVCIPFDRRRQGIIPGEASASIILERRRHAEQRGATILAELTGFSTRFATPQSSRGGSQAAISNAIQSALTQSGIATDQLAVIAAQGFSNNELDIVEAQGIAQVAPKVPVTAYSSYVGTTGAACGIVDLIAGLVATSQRKLLPTLGYQTPDSDCPVRVVTEVSTHDREYMLKLSFTPLGHAAAVVLRCNR